MSGLDLILAFAVIVALFVTFYPNKKTKKAKRRHDLDLIDKPALKSNRIA